MRKTAVWVFLIVLLAVALAACGEPPLTAKETAEAFLQALEGQEFPHAYELLSADLQASIPAERFNDMVKGAWAESGVAGFRVESVQQEILFVGGNRASVPYSVSVTTADGATNVMFNALTLVKQDEQWRVVWPPIH